MARDSKGRFLKRGRGARGLGTIITVKRGMGALPGGAMGEAVIAPAVGGLTTALVTLAIRQMVVPSQGETQRTLVRYAPLFGGLAGAVSSLALMLLGGSNAAISGFVSTIAVVLGLYGQDMILTGTMGPGIAASLPPPSAATGGEGVAGYRRLGRGRMGAIVPEYARRGGGMGALVMEPVGPAGRRAGTLGRTADYGEVVSLGGLNVGAFGTPGFRA